MPPPSTEQSFRANLSQFRWARGVNDDTQQQQPTTQPGNPFSRFYNAVAGDYIPLRSNEQSNEDEAWFALSRWERWVLRVQFCRKTKFNRNSFRLLGFGGCLIGAAICFVIAFFTLPFLAIRYVLFTLSYTFHDSIRCSRPAKFALAFRYVPYTDLARLDLNLCHQFGKLACNVWVGI